MTRSRTLKKKQSLPKSKPKKSSPPPAPTKVEQPGFLGQMAGTMAQGFAFGSGSSVAHQLFDGIFGSKEKQVLVDDSYKKCKPIMIEYKQCLQNNFDSSACQEILNKMDLSKHKRVFFHSLLKISYQTLFFL